VVCGEKMAGLIKMDLFFFRYVKYFIFAILLESCWTGESPIKVKDDLGGGFKIIENETNPQGEFILALNHDEVFYQTIEQRCKLIYFDSAKIYVKSNWNPASDRAISYHEVRIDSPGADSHTVTSFIKNELTQSEFERLVKECNTCSVKDYSKN
jgi:hypothetical protein